MVRDLQFEMVYTHSPETIWRALTHPAALAEWLMPNNFAPRVGHKFEFRTKPAPGFDGIVHCEVLELNPPKRLVYSWNGGGLHTRVVWTLEASPEGTKLRLDHTGFRGVRGWMTSRILGKGWRSKILVRNLPALLAKWAEDGPGSELGAAEGIRPVAAYELNELN
jgi:uncharacterized protein YndB with AHSA1/START domain